MSIEAKMLAVSMAGHDKGKTYVVTETDGDTVLLSDGRLRPLDKPKRKNTKHVQLIRHLPQELLAQMEQIGTDADIRRILSDYNRVDQQEE